MSISELDLSPRLKGRAAKAVEVSFVREVSQADLSLLAGPRGSSAPRIARLRDRHHALARCLAMGMTNTEASAVTGYDPSRISILLGDPTFLDLVADYKTMEDGFLAEFKDRAEMLTLTAMEVIQEHLEDEDIAPSAKVGMALEAAKTFADRTGHAPVTKNLNLNANMDFGDALSKARERVRDRLTKSGEDGGGSGTP